jgi:hypothetical protein
MSDSLKIVLNVDEYNAIFGLAGTINGVYGTVASAKIRDLISAEVQKYSNDGQLPKSITLDIPKKILDGFYLGLTEKTKEKDLNTLSLVQIKAVAAVLKMKGRMEKFLDAEFEKIPENSEDFDQEEITEPFDEVSETEDSSKGVI